MSLRPGSAHNTFLPHWKFPVAGALMDPHRVSGAAVRASKAGADGLAARTLAAADVARRNAATVDDEARFPREAFAEIRRQRLLGIMVPRAFGGEGVGLAEIVDICYALGQTCSSTALIFAMHQIKTACIVRHTNGNGTLERILRRVATEQLLLASSTTEGQAGGNVRSSEAALEPSGDEFTLERKATVISYATAADGIVTTARRAADAAASDQVLLVLLKDDYTLERLNAWDTLGMRGTQSEGYTLRARASLEQRLTDPYERIHSQTMVPHAHLLWGSVWAGIAAAATTTAQAFLRHAARQGNERMPPGAAHFAQAMSTLRTLRGVLASALRAYEAVMADEKSVASLQFQSMITLTKVQTSELATATVLSALRVCGLSGYRNDGEYTIGRQLRDVLSAPLMINNDRILANLAAASLMTPLPTSISG
ncbi:MAG: acyl-CoA dehydrogenase family protein [Steroidobacteraceae bacterium]